MINRATTHQFTNIAFQDTWKHCCRAVKKECKLKQPERLTNLLPSCFVFEAEIFAYSEKPFEQTLKLKKSI